MPRTITSNTLVVHGSHHYPVALQCTLITQITKVDWIPHVLGSFTSNRNAKTFHACMWFENDTERMRLLALSHTNKKKTSLLTIWENRMSRNERELLLLTTNFDRNINNHAKRYKVAQRKAAEITFDIRRLLSLGINAIFSLFVSSKILWETCNHATQKNVGTTNSFICFSSRLMKLYLPQHIWR